MRSAKRVSLWLVLAGLLAARAALAQSQLPAAEAKAFVKEYVAAYNAKDAARLQGLYAPRSRACITPENKDYYETTQSLMWQTPIPSNYTFTLSAINEGNLKAVENFGRFLLKPERELHIDYQQGNDLGTVVLYMVDENGHWFADQPCASEATIKQFRDQAPERAHYKAVAGAIQEPLRSQLLALLREHETGAAVDRYMKATGQDGRTAILVMNQLSLDAK